MADPIRTYDELVQALQEAAEDVGSELEDFMPVIIDNAENRLVRELDHLAPVYTSTITVSPSVATFPKPNGHKVTYHLKYTDPTTNKNHVLSRRTDDYLAEYWPQETSVGTPVYYAEEDLNTFKIAPCVSASASIEVRGIRRPAPLSLTNSTNVWTSVAPDALFHACMIEVGTWQRNQLLRETHKELYISARDSINNEGRRQRRDDGSPVNNPERGQNTLGTADNK